MGYKQDNKEFRISKEETIVVVSENPQNDEALEMLKGLNRRINEE